MALKSNKQKVFVAEYLVDFNATQAAARAGYKDPNIGRHLIAKKHVDEAIQAAIEKRKVRTQITQDLVLEGLLREAQLDDERSSHAARVSAWEKLGKYLGLFEKDNAQKNRDAVIAVLAMLPESARLQIKNVVLNE